MHIVNKALYREIFTVFLVTILVLLIVILTTQLAKYLAWAASGRIAADSVFSILGLKLPTYLIRLVPLGMFLATLLVFGRMGQDRELVVLLASGVGFDKISKMVFKLAVVFSLILAILSFFVSPLAERQSDIMHKTYAKLGILEGIAPGKFNELPGGNRTLYAEKVDSNNTLHNVFVRVHTEKSQHILKAKKGAIKTEDGYAILTLYDGTRNSRKNKTLEFSIVKYKTHGIVLAESAPRTAVYAIDGMPSKLLLQDLHNPESLGEILWRLSIPIMGLVLMMLGVGLSSYRPRSGKYGNLLPGVVIYSVYFSVLKTFKYELDSGNFNAGYGIWLLHGLMLALAIWTILRTLKPLKS